jgi:hypothetical protein
MTMSRYSGCREVISQFVTRSCLLATGMLISGQPVSGQEVKPETQPPAAAVVAPQPEEIEVLVKKPKLVDKSAAASEKSAAESPPATDTQVKNAGEKTPADDPDQPAGNKSEEKPKQKSIQDSIKKRLISAAQTQIPNPVESILDRMRNVQERLTQTATDKETRQEQTQIVQEIDKLIEALKNQKPPPPSSNSSSDPNSPPPPPSTAPPMGSGQADDKQQGRGKSQPQPGNSQKQQNESSGEKEKAQQGQKQKQQAGQTESVSDKSRDSNNTNAKRRTVEEEAARQRMAKDIWGHLPPAKRAELLNIISEKYIPKYDEQVRRYYEALAEEVRGNK